MKFWQLHSILRDSNVLKEILKQHQRWEKYLRLLENFSHYVQVQDRRVLNQIVDGDLCRAALEAWGHHFWVDNQGCLREHHKDINVPNEKLIPAYAAYVKYGADVLEDVQEKGCVKVSLV